MDELIKQVSSYGLPGIIIGVLLYALRWLFLRYDKAMQDQIEIGKSAIIANQSAAAATEKAAQLLEAQQARLDALRVMLDGRRP